MAITSAICNRWVSDLGLGLHNHNPSGGHTFTAALFVTAATLGATTTAYSSTNEVPNGGGYTTGGQNIAAVAPVEGNPVIFDWADPSWASATLTDVRGVMVYNNTHSLNGSVFVIDFGGAQQVTAGTISVQWPLANSTNAIVRL